MIFFDVENEAFGKASWNSVTKLGELRNQTP